MSLTDNNCNIILIGSSTGGLPIVEFILKKIKQVILIRLKTAGVFIKFLSHVCHRQLHRLL